MMFFCTVSYLGLLLSAVVGTAIGYLWYSEFLFAKKWMELSRIHPKQIENSNMTMSMGVGFGVTLVLAFCLASMYHYFGSLKSALMALEFLIFFVAVESLGGLIWEKMPLALYLINLGHKAVSWLMMLLVYVAIFNTLS